MGDQSEDGANLRIRLVPGKAPRYINVADFESLQAAIDYAAERDDACVYIGDPAHPFASPTKETTDG